MPYILCDGKFLECHPSTCNVQKSPKETPSGSTKKRNRKKKVSESEPESVKSNDNDEASASISEEVSHPNVKKIVSLGVLVAVIAVALLYFSGTATS